MNFNKLTKQELINICQDLFGYSQDNFDFCWGNDPTEPMTKNEILDYLTDKQKQQLKNY